MAFWSFRVLGVLLLFYFGSFVLFPLVGIVFFPALGWFDIFLIFHTTVVVLVILSLIGFSYKLSSVLRKRVEAMPDAHSKSDELDSALADVLEQVVHDVAMRWP